MRTLVEEFFNGDLESAVAKLPSRAERIAAYESAMEGITNSEDWETPDMRYADGTIQGIEHHGQTKFGGAYADAVALQARGYAIGDIPG